MSKTCQLCGKPLGRRGDGEFCSSEHRNQFRLRRGMDRLEEANKVASLMRRRENLRQIPATGLAAAGACEPRASTDPVRFPAPQVALRLRPLNPVLFEARVPQREDRFSNPLSDLLRRCGGPAGRMLTPASLPFVARRATPVLDSKKNTKPGAGVVRAGSARIFCEVPGVKPQARECGAALRVSRRHIGAARQSELSGGAGGGLDKSRQFQALVLTATAGDAGEIKAYPGRAFVKRSPLLRTAPENPKLQSGLPEPKPQPGARPGMIDILPSTRGCDIDRTAGVLRLPVLRATIAAAGARAGGVSPMRATAFEPALADPRLCAMRWEGTSAIAMPGFRS